MSRPSSIHRLVPATVREELDQRLLDPAFTQLETLAWVRGQGYDIRKSALNRYAQQLQRGREELSLYRVDGQTLAYTLLGMMPSADDDLAALVEEWVGCQIRQQAALARLHAYLRDQARDQARAAEAQAWAARHLGVWAMTERLTAAQIADIRRVSKRAIEIRAKKEHWPYEEVPVRGGRQRLYTLSALPAKARAAIENARLAAACKARQEELDACHTALAAQKDAERMAAEAQAWAARHLGGVGHD